MSTRSLPLIIDTSELHTMLPAEDILLIAVVQERVFLHQHLPGSTLIQPGELVGGLKPAVGKLPAQEHLSVLFSRVGLHPDKHVIAYDDEGGGWAGRLIWTLDVLGHRGASYLDGGLTAWIGAGLPTESGPAQDASSTYSANIDPEQLVTMAQLRDQITVPGIKVWDARSREEYEGSKLTALQNGHIPGAVNLDWLDLMDRDNYLRLLPMPEIAQRLQSLGLDTGNQVITHCQTHHRSGLTYLVGKALGMNIKAYDGSWSEWGNQPDTPVATGPEKV